jgi:hypothetical protein
MDKREMGEVEALLGNLVTDTIGRVEENSINSDNSTSSVNNRVVSRTKQRRCLTSPVVLKS